MTDRELLDRKGHEVNDELPPLPEPAFSSWHGDDCKTLLNPTGVCNAFPWPPSVPETPYWVDKGYHGEPLFTSDQLRAYARAAVLAERLATLEAVNALIKDGPFKGNGYDDLAQNNGVILAANLLASRVYAIRKGTT